MNVGFKIHLSSIHNLSSYLSSSSDNSLSNPFKYKSFNPSSFNIFLWILIVYSSVVPSSAVTIIVVCVTSLSNVIIPSPLNTIDVSDEGIAVISISVSSSYSNTSYVWVSGSNDGF